MNTESVVQASREYIRPARQPDVYGPLRRTLPIGDLKRKLIMRRPMTRITDTLLHAGVDSVMDVGCGTGVLARNLSDRGFQVTGIDSSRTMLKRARTVAPKIELQWVDSTLMAHDRVYDAAVVSLALHEMSSDIRIQTWFNTMQAVKIGGLVVALDFVAPASDSLYTRLVRAQIERDERAFDRVNPDHYTNYRQFMATGGLSAWLQAVGANIESERYFLAANLGLFTVRV